MNNEIITVEDLVKIYPNGIIANDHINLKVKKGEIIGIIGPNGAGKTTLIKQLTGELIPTSGNIYIMDNDMVKNPNPIKYLMGVSPQEGGLINYLTVEEHIYYFARLKGLSKEKAIENTRKILDLLNLKSHMKKRIDELSGGLRRRVFVSIALVNDPDLIFLDEPTTGLDPMARIDFWNTLQTIIDENPDRTIIITTHYLEELEKISNRLIFINKGKVLLDGDRLKVRDLILDYDIKISFPLKFKDALTDVLIKEGIKFQTKEEHGFLNVLLLKKDISKIMPILLQYTNDIIISSPTLDEVFMKVMENEKNTR
ncbi:MAG: ABC transporter ATP-binding protein [Thermoplasmata archaeon]